MARRGGRWGMGGAAALFLALAPAAAQEAKTWTLELNQDLRFVSWTGSRGFPTANRPLGNFRGKGLEVFAPFGLQLSGTAGDVKVEALFRSGVVRAEQRTFDLAGRHEGLTDSVVSTTFTYQGFAGVQPFASLNLNLPTGKRVLGTRASLAQMDPDIVEVPSFGEGFNIGPTLGVNVPVTAQWLVSASVGYTARRAFRRGSIIDGAPSVQRLAPGDELGVNGSVNYASEALSAAAALAVAFPRTDRLDGLFSIRSGLRFSLVFDLGYRWSERWRTQAQVAVSHSRRNQVLDNALLAVVTEPFNANSTRTTASLSHVYSLDKWSFGANLGLLHRDRNAFDSLDLRFIPAKTKLSAGGSIEYRVSPEATLSLRADRFWIVEGDQPDKLIGGVIAPGLAVPTLAHRGWSGGLSGSIRF